MLDAHQIEIVLEQGKYYQVKRMLAAAGNHCSSFDASGDRGTDTGCVGTGRGRVDLPGCGATGFVESDLT